MPRRYAWSEARMFACTQKGLLRTHIYTLTYTHTHTTQAVPSSTSHRRALTPAPSHASPTLKLHTYTHLHTHTIQAVPSPTSHQRALTPASHRMHPPLLNCTLTHTCMNHRLFPPLQATEEHSLQPHIACIPHPSPPPTHSLEGYPPNADIANWAASAAQRTRLSPSQVRFL